MLFHKYVGENVEVTNFMSHFSMFVPTKSDVKLDNGNMGHAQVIGIILCHFTNCPIIYPVVPVYYYPGNNSNNISSGDLKFILVFKKLHMNILNIVILYTLKVVLGDHPTRLGKH